MLEQFIKISLFVIIVILLGLGIKKNDYQLKEGQKYRNYFKTIGLGLSLVSIIQIKNEKLKKVIIVNVFTFLLYILMIASSMAFISMFIEGNSALFLVAGMVIVLSVLLNFYISYINKLLFKEYEIEVEWRGNIK